MIKQVAKRTLLMLMGVMTMCFTYSETIIKVEGLEYTLSGAYATVYGIADGNTNQTVTIPPSIEYNGLSYKVNVLSNACFCNYYENYNGKRFTVINGVSHEGAPYCKYTKGEISDAGRRARNNSYVRNIILPNTISSIGEYSFSNSNITYVKLEEGIKILGELAFNLANITSIIIPSTVQTFGMDIFRNCKMLRTIIYLGSTPPSSWSATSTTFVPSKSAYGNPSYSINNAEIVEMLSFTETTFVYSGKAPFPTYINNMEDYSVSLEMQLKLDRGTYEEVFPATFTKVDESFTAYIPYKYTIDPVKLNAKVNSTSRTYGEANPNFTITYSGFVNGEGESVLTSKPVAATIANEKSAVGSYPITISGGKAKNYTFEYEQGELIVNKASLGIQVMDASKVYGTDNPTFTLGYSGLKNNETVPEWTTKPTFATTATKASSAGVYEVSVTCDPRNYTITMNTLGKLTITKAPLTIKANNATMDYCGTMPTYSYTYSGFVNGDDETTLSKKPSIATDATTTSNAGEYVITPEGAEAANYDFTYTAGTLTINKRPLTVKANSVSRLYGEDNPTFTVEYSGFVNSETKAVLDVEPTASTTATIKSQAGSYDIMVSDGKAKNYTFNYQSGQLTITPRTLKAFVDDYERAYGEENPPFTIEYDGFVLNDNKNSLMTQPTAYTSAKKTSNVGTYAIEVLGGYSPNYTFTYGSGTLTIVKAEQTFTWDQDLSNLKVGDQVELQAYASSNLPITFTMDSEDFAEIYKAGSKTYMECKKAGSFHIKAVQEGNDNYYSTQRINKSVTIVEEGASAVEATSGSKVSIQATVGGIVITGVSSDDVIHVYNIDGILQKAVRAEGSQVEIPLYKDNVYVIKIGPKTVKLRL